MSNNMPDPRVLYYDTINNKRYNGRLLRSAGLTTESPGVVVLHDVRPVSKRPEFFFVVDSQTCEEIDGKWYIRYVEQLRPTDDVKSHAKVLFAGAIERLNYKPLEVDTDISLLVSKQTVDVLKATIANKQNGMGFNPNLGFMVKGCILDKSVEQLQGYLVTVKEHLEKCGALRDLLEDFIAETDAETIVLTSPDQWVVENY